MNEPPLRGLRVIVTRPALQADDLCRQLERAGAEAARLPLFTIDAVADDQTLAQWLRKRTDAQLWIFTSRNAVERAVAALPDEPWPPLLAVGEASAQALRDAGHPDVITPAETNSEGLLALAELAPERVSGRSLLIIGGEGGRDLLETELSARGAVVNKLALYRRTPVSYSEERVRGELLVADILLLSSAEAMERLLELCDERDRSRLCALPIIVSSARLQRLALQRGFTHAEVAASALDADQLSAVEAMAKAWRSDRDGHSPEPSATATQQVDQLGSAAQSAAGDVAATASGSPEATTSTAAPAPASFPQRTRAQWSLTGVLVVGLLLAAAWIWYAERSARQQRSAQALALAELTREFSDSRSQVGELGEGLSSMSRELQRAAQERRLLADRVQDHTQLMNRVGAELRGGYRRLMLEACEQLLVEASDALLLRQDLRTAIIALELADRRLSLLRDPRLLPLRQQIHNDLLSLQAVKMPDTVEASLRLSSLTEAALNMPLLGQRGSRTETSDQIPTRELATPQQQSAPAQPPAASAVTWLRALFGRLVTVERVDDPMRHRQLPEAERFAVRQVLMLRLEATRLALLQRNSAVLQTTANEAHRWLAREFDPDDPAVELALRDLELIAALDFSPALPELDASLNMLKEQLDPGPTP